MKPRGVILSLLVVLLLAPTGFSQESKASWNPFSKGDSADDGSTIRESSFFNGSGGKSMFKLPKLPWFSKDSSSKPKSESALSRMGKTTKRWWSNTVDLMNPFDSPAPKRNQGYQPQNMQRKSSGGGPLGWLWREEPRENPTTVNEFLRQPRPKF